MCGSPWPRATRIQGEIVNWKNPVKARLQAGEPVFGATITVPNPDVASHLAAAGFDFLWFEMEHSPITLESLRAMILATRGLPAIPITRVPVNEIWAAKRVLDAGSAGVIFPFTETAEMAQQASAACKYPPAGRRGSGANLASFRWPVENYYDTADREFLVVAVVEQASALEEIDEIAATEGIDVLFIGTSDLSFSLGLRGDQNAPELRQAVTRIRDAALANGKWVGRPAFPRDQIANYISEGFQFFQVETDLGFLQDGARRMLESVGRAAKVVDYAI